MENDKTENSVASHCSSSDWEYEQFVSEFDPNTECHRCWGSGEVPTMDYESYTGQDYKPCPKCGGTGEAWHHAPNRAEWHN